MHRQKYWTYEGVGRIKMQPKTNAIKKARSGASLRVCNTRITTKDDAARDAELKTIVFSAE